MRALAMKTLRLARMRKRCPFLEERGIALGMCYAVRESEDGSYFVAFGSDYHDGDDVEVDGCPCGTPCMECDAWELGRRYANRGSGDEIQALMHKSNGRLLVDYLRIRHEDPLLKRGFFFGMKSYSNPVHFHNYWEEAEEWETSGSQS